MAESAADRPLWVWRHPRPEGAAGRCIGAGTDLPVHWRRAKRLARRIQAHARRHRLTHRVRSSPLRRAADVGRWLRRWGWQHEIDARLLELDFGAWDGRRWSEIAQQDVEAWTQDFAQHAPGGGESLAALMRRCRAQHAGEGQLLISHGGWMLARRWLQSRAEEAPTAARWPRPPRYGECWELSLPR